MPKRLIIGLTGTNASGKGTVADFLKKKGFSYHSLSDVIREELKSKNITITRNNLIKEGNRLRSEFGSAVLAKRIKERLTDNNTIVDSIRNPDEVEEFRKFPDFVLVAIDAPLELRFQRAMARGRAENAKTLEEFRLLEEKEKNTKDSTAQQIDKCINIADEKLANDSTFEALYEKIEKTLKTYEN